MTVKNLILCSVSMAIILTTGGCYTVFRTTSLDVEPPAEESSEIHYQFGGDIAFDNYTHDRWVYYLFCPWWEESIFLQWVDDEADNDEPTEYTGETEVIYGPPPTVEHIIIVPTTPALVPVDDQPEIRHKPSDDSGSESATSVDVESTPSKPKRRGGGR